MKFIPKELKETADISRGKIGFRGWVKNAAVGLLTLGLLYVGIGLVTDLVVVNISEETEAQWFAGTIPETGDGQSEGFQRVQRIFQRLITSSDLRPLPYRLFLLDIQKPNAVAVPGGGVGVTRALLQEVKSEIGLATVLAHELGHQEHRHGLKRFGRVLLWRMLLNFALADVDISGLEIALSATEASYSRDQEREADVFGMRLVHEVYGDTQGALEFFELVQRKHEQGDAQWTGLLTSHPLTAERIAYLKRLQQQLRDTSNNATADGVGSLLLNPPSTSRSRLESGAG